MRLVLYCAAALLAACSRDLPQARDAATSDTTITVAPVAPVAAVADTAPSVAAPIASTAAGSVADPAEPQDSANDLRSFASGLIIPVQGVVASQLRDSYTEARAGHSHQALDIMAPRGTPVLSATNGRLLKLFHSVPGGTMVYAADSSDQFILMYGHLDRYADGVVNGMPLARGQIIGYVGSTGDADAGAPHLHFAIARGHPSIAWWKGEPINPFPLLTRP